MNTARYPGSLPTAGPVVGAKTSRPCLDAATARVRGDRFWNPDRPDELLPPERRGRGADFSGLTVWYGVAPTPVGFAFVAATGRGVCALSLHDTDDPCPGLARLRRDRPGASTESDPDWARTLVDRAVGHLNDGRACDDVPLDLRGTPFRLRVWQALRAIPRGTTSTYGAVASSLGLPAGSARAVGTACGANPVSLFVACHRVVRSDGGLGGYYWGLDRKRALLAMEGVVPPGP